MLLMIEVFELWKEISLGGDGRRRESCEAINSWGIHFMESGSGVSCVVFTCFKKWKSKHLFSLCSSMPKSP
jgi:hypothetical protein